MKCWVPFCRIFQSFKLFFNCSYFLRQFLEMGLIMLLVVAAGALWRKACQWESEARRWRWQISGFLEQGVKAMVNGYDFVGVWGPDAHCRV